MVNVAHFGAVRFAVRLAVLNDKRITSPILARYGSRSNTNGSVRFALLTVRLKNGSLTVAIAVKNGTVKKTVNGTDTVRYGHGDKFGRTIVIFF